MGATRDIGSAVNLQRPPDKDGRAAAAALIPIRMGWVPDTMPTRLASQELQSLEAWAKVAVFLKEEDSTGLMEGMDKGTAATS